MKSTYLAPGEEVSGWAYVSDVSGLELAHGAFLITQLYVPPKCRGNGMARAILTEITNDADKEGIPLILDFQPEEFGSDLDKLKKLYESFGFRWIDELGGMRRDPAR